MKRSSQIAFCCFAFLILCSTTKAQNSFFKTSSFAAQTHYGSFITILPKAAYLRDSYSCIGEISFQRNNKRTWSDDSQFVQWGAGIFFGNTGSKKYVGNMKGAFSFINLPVYKKSNFQSKLRMGGGVGWVQKPYDKNTNHKNVLLGTALNAYLNFIWQNEFKILPKTYFNLGFSFSHLSNGSSTLPNLGLNIPAVSAGLRYAFDDTAVTQITLTDSFQKTWSYKLYGSLGIKQHPWIGSKRYAVNILSGELTKKISRKHQYGGGVVVFYDGSLEVNPRTITSDKRKGNNFQAGVFGSYEYSIGKISLPMQLGAYVFNHDVYSVIFQQFGIRYQFSNSFSAQLMLKSYGGKADVIHAGIGYKLK